MAWVRDALELVRDKKFESTLEDAIYNSQRAMAESGHGALPGLEAGTSAEGMDTAIGGLLSGMPALEQARTGAATGYLDSVGLGGRAGAATAAGKMTPADAFAIEDELNRRRQGLTGIGMTGMGVQSDALNAQGVRGQTQSLMRAQNKAQNRTNNMNMLGGLIGSMGNMNFGGGGAGSNQSDYTGAAMANWLGNQ